MVLFREQAVRYQRTVLRILLHPEGGDAVEGLKAVGLVSCCYR